MKSLARQTTKWTGITSTWWWTSIWCVHNWLAEEGKSYLMGYWWVTEWYDFLWLISDCFVSRFSVHVPYAFHGLLVLVHSLRRRLWWCLFQVKLIQRMRWRGSNGHWRGNFSGDSATFTMTCSVQVCRGDWLITNDARGELVCVEHGTCENKNYTPSV